MRSVLRLRLPPDNARAARARRANKKMTRHLTLLALLMILRPHVAAQPVVSDPRGYVSYRATSPVTVDGRLDDGAWRDAPWTDDFVDIEGDRKPRPALRTRARMLWDDSYFYIGAELVEPQLWATITQHDAVIFHENDFELFIDPNGDNHEYYELEINALGTVWDLLLPRPYKDGGKAVNNWEILGLKSAVHLDGTLNVVTDTDRGWSVELAVPWGALGELARRSSPPADGDQWRVNFSRVQWALEVSNGAYHKVKGRSENNWVWSPQHVVNMHRPETWGYVQFASGRPGSATFRTDASLPARRWLHEVYYAQRAFQQANGRWANSLEELRVAGPSDGPLTAAVLHVAGSQFQASITLRIEGSNSERWNIRQDSLVWRE
jgi:cellulose/xylan binding protein with CBM9 domain